MKVLNRLIPTGSSSLDHALDGGLPQREMCLLYGGAETGKSALAMRCAVNCARLSFKTLYVDCEGTFLPERLSQIATKDFGEVSDSIIVAKPATFEEQVAFVDNLERFVGRRFGLIVFDTITSLYRSELLNKKETFNLNRELNGQVATLAEIAKKLELSILLVSQVRSVIPEADVAPVATRVLKFWCDSVVGLSRVGSRNMVKASVEKSGGKETKTSFYLVIGQEGLLDYHLKT